MKYLKLLPMIFGLFTANSFADNYQVVANESFPVDEISAGELRRIFLLKMKNVGGVQVTVTNLEKDVGTRADFSNAVLQKTADQIERYYLKLSLSGKGSPLKPFGSESAMIEKLKAETGAIGYVANGTSVAGVKVLQVN